MRKSLEQSVAESPVRNFERYPKNSIVLCNACALPIFRLDRGIDLGQRAGQAASAFVPISLADLLELEGRADIDAGIRAVIASWSPEAKRAHLQQLHEMRAGMPMACPVCHDCFVQVLSTEMDETHDRAYTLELLTVPPIGGGRPAPVRGLHIAGDRGDWVHEPRRRH